MDRVHWDQLSAFLLWTCIRMYTQFPFVMEKVYTLEHPVSIHKSKKTKRHLKSWLKDLNDEDHESDSVCAFISSIWNASPIR